MYGAPRSVWIPVEEGIVGVEYCGYKTFDAPGTTHFCTTIYKGDGKADVYGHPVKNISELERETSWQERDAWYVKQFDLTNSKNQLNLLGLYNDMYDVGDAYHEMWNAWVGVDFYEMNSDCVENNIVLVGIAPAPWGCASIEDPVAFVAENEDGTRFWSHGGQSWVNDMREQMRDIYDNYTKGR